MRRGHVVLAITALLASFIAAQTTNHNPRFDPGPDVEVDEDSGGYANRWALNPRDSEGLNGVHSGAQTLSFVVRALNPSLFSVQPSVNSQGFLYFTPAPNAFGTSQVEITLTDDGAKQCVPATGPIPPALSCPGGCSPVDCSVSATTTMQISVLPVNDCPTFNVRGDVTVDEDSGQANIAGWASSVSRGADNENTQRLTFTVTTDNPGLFQQQPQVVWDPANPTSGTLQFTPMADKFGTATISVTAEDDGGNKGCSSSIARSATITITARNDKPSFTFGPTPVTVKQDTAGSFPSWASNPNTGNQESSQSFNFNLQFANPADANKFTVPPRIDPTTMALTFTPAPGANTFGGSVFMRVQMIDNGGDFPNDRSCNPIETCPLLEIQITPVNAAPSFVGGPNIEVYENLRNLNPTPVPPIYPNGRQWATQISVGGGNEGTTQGQQPSFVVTSSNPGLYDKLPAVDPLGTLTFTLKEDACGVDDNIRVVLWDNGSPPMSYDLSPPFSIVVRCVNTAPSFEVTHPNPIKIKENQGLVDIATWAINARPGPPLEVTGSTATGRAQTLQVLSEPLDPSFFAVQPRFTLRGSTNIEVQFQVKDNLHGTTQVRVILQDDGGTIYGGVDTFVYLLTIEVAEVNQPPTFKFMEGTVNITEGQYLGGYTRSGFVYDISPGAGEPFMDPQIPGSQSVTFIVNNDNMQLFRVQPMIDNNGALSFTPEQYAFGTAIVSVRAQDSGLPPAQSNISQFTIRILPVNNAPTFDLQGDLIGSTVTECTEAGMCARTFPNFLTNLRYGPTNEQQILLPLVVTTPQSYLAKFTPTGVPAIDQTTGSLTFELALYQHTALNEPIVITVTAQDNGGVLNNGVDRTTKSFKLEIRNQPNPPSFTAGDLTITVDENSPEYRQSWATNVKASPTDTTLNGLTFNVQAMNPAAFAVQPMIVLAQGNTGTLSFTPARDWWGTTTLGIILNNVNSAQNSNVATVTVIVRAINSAPIFTKGPDLVLNQNSGSYVAQWATGISPGPNEAHQKVTFSVTCLDNSLFTVPPTITPEGELTVVVANSVSGMTQCTARLRDNGGTGNSTNDVDSTSKTFLVTVRYINQPPTFSPGVDVTVMQNAPVIPYPNFVTNVANGQGNTANQLLTFVLSVDNPLAFEVTPKITISGTTGSLAFTPKKDVVGVFTVTYYLKNDGSNTPPDRNRSPDHTFRIIIEHVNTAPSFVAGMNLTVLENSGVFRQPQWARMISKGPEVDSTQTLQFVLVPRDRNLFNLQPAVDAANGDIMFSTATNMHGTTTVAVCLLDNGGTANGGQNQRCESLAIAILPVNNPPSAIAEPAVSTLENTAYTRTNFLSMVQTGPTGPEDTQLIIRVTVIVPDAMRYMFATQPTITLDTYSLSFTPTQNVAGNVDCQIEIQDNGGTSNGGVDVVRLPLRISILEVNSRPTFLAGPRVTVLQNSGVYNALWATNINPGPEQEASQAVTFAVTVNKPQYFTTQPAIDSNGYLSFTVAPAVYGNVNLTVIANDNGGNANGGNSASLPAVGEIDIRFVNQAPRFTVGPDLTLLENAPPFRRAQWATGIIAGTDMEQLSQLLDFVVTPIDTTFFATQPTIDAQTGDLIFTLARNRFGVTTLDVQLRDNGGTANGGLDRSPTYRLTLDVTNVNQPPVLATQGDISVFENSGDRVIQGWVTQASPGDGEDQQTVVLSVSTTNPSLFASPPRLAGRDLLFTPAAFANGVATIILNATDNGGTANGGINKASVSFVITIVAVNNRPLLTKGADITVHENNGPTTVRSWLVMSAPGPANEAGQTVTPHFAMDRPDLLAGLPLLNLETGDLQFTPQLNAYGIVTVSLYLTDNGGRANNGSDTSETVSFRITITPVNQPPSFTPGSPVMTLPNTVGAYSVPWASNVSAGPNEDNQTVAFSTITSTTTLFTADGQPSMSPNGVLSFVVGAGAIGNTTLSITLRDSENAAAPTQFINLQIRSALVNNNIVMLLNGIYENFNVEHFRTVIANHLSIDRSQVIIVSVAPGSVRVVFQILSTPNGRSSDQLTMVVVNDAQNQNSELSRQLNVVSVTTEPATAGGVTGVAPSNNAHRTTNRDSVNWVGLAFGIAAGIFVIVIVVLAIVLYRRERNLHKTEGVKSTHYPDYVEDEYDSPHYPAYRRKGNPIPPTFVHAAPVAGHGDRYGYASTPTHKPAPPLPPPPMSPALTRYEPRTMYRGAPSIYDDPRPVEGGAGRVYAQPSPHRSRWPDAY